MTLRLKVVIAALGALMLVAALIYVSSSAIVRDFLTQVEEERVAGQLQGAREGLREEVADLRLHAQDLAAETVAFDSSLAQSVAELRAQRRRIASDWVGSYKMRSNRLDIVVVTDGDGQVLLGTSRVSRDPFGQRSDGDAQLFAGGTKQSGSDGPTFPTHLAENADLLAFARASGLTVSGESDDIVLSGAPGGIVLLGTGVYLAMAQPIPTAEGRARSSVGFVLLGRKLDASLLGRLSKITGGQLSLIPDPDGAAEYARVAADGSIVIGLISSELSGQSSVSAAATIVDSKGDKLATLRSTTERSILKKGIDAFGPMLTIRLSVGIFFIALGVLLLELFVLRRVRRFGARVSEIAVSKDLSKRIGSKGSDELAHLGTQIDNMLERLEESDIARRAAEDALRDSEGKYHTVVDHSLDGIVILQDFRIVYANPSAMQLVELDESQIGTLPFADVISDGYRSLVVERHRRRLLGEKMPSQYEIELTTKSGARIPAEINVSRIEFNGRPATLASIRDMTDRRKADEAMRRLADHDHLTGLYNRKVFYDRLAQSVAQARRNESMVAVLYLDLDGFKAVNDSSGHHVGDALLKVLARRLECCIRETDAVARIGGDEFVIIQNNIKDPASAGVLADKLIKSISEPLMLEVGTIEVGASIGITVYPLDDSSVDDLITHADTAMYRAKRAGKGRWEMHALDTAT